MPVTIYLLKTLACSAILYTCYFFVLRNKTHHHFNRLYLLTAVLLSVLAPLFQINIPLREAIEQNNAFQLLQAVSNNSSFDEEAFIPTGGTAISLQAICTAIYLCISTLLLLRFIHALVQIKKLYQAGIITVKKDYTLVECQAPGTPFSFLKCIFWNAAIDINSAEGNSIFRHELAHVKGRHSIDNICLHLLLVVCWYNPVLWLIKRELRQLHEFIADKAAIADGGKAELAAMLLHAIYPVQFQSLAQPFFTSPIKRRIAMISKHHTRRIAAKLLILPAALLLASAFSVNIKKTPVAKTASPITVILDAGHGGHDYGGASNNGKHLEKDICLAIAEKAMALNTNERIRLLLSRQEDVYISPPERVKFTKEKQGDIFISIHVDAETDNKAATGASIFIARNEFANAEKSRPLASALADVFKSNYALPVAANLQQRNTGIWVLQANDCPAVLIEAGYITNNTDLQYLLSEKGKETIAMNILRGIEKYAAGL
jgi:N-acetylmuramoyl-L-alanine amidase